MKYVVASLIGFLVIGFLMILSVWVSICGWHLPAHSHAVIC